MSDNKEDNYLLDSLASGDERGIMKIYEKVFPKVLNYVVKSSGNEDDAKDVFQKGLIQLSTRAQSQDFSIKSTFEGYLFTTCQNVWRRELKISKARVTNDEVIHLVSEEREIALTALEQEKWELFQEKLKEISENCRKMLSYFFQKIPYTEIAEKLGYSSENVVRQRIFKCKAKLKDAIKSDSRYDELKEL